MKTYKDSNSNSNILGYEYGEDWIRIYFKDNSEYEYTGNSVSFYVLNQMKQLADLGDGLNAFINKEKPPYSSKR